MHALLDHTVCSRLRAERFRLLHAGAVGGAVIFAQWVGPFSSAFTHPLASHWQASLTNTATGLLADAHPILLAAPADMVLPSATLTLGVAAVPNADASINVTVSTTATALFVTLTTTEQGVFTDNAFILPVGNSRELQLRAIAGAPAPDPVRLKATLRADHVAAYSLSPC